MVAPDRGRLADGREILYFDAEPGRGRGRIADAREPTETAKPAGELRFDPLAREWVVYAAQRQDRTFLPAAESCPLCPSAPGRATEIPAPDYDVVVFENRFPALSGAAPGVAAPGGGAFELGRPSAAGAAGMITSPGHGRCEVVCFTADHQASFASLSQARVGTIMAAWANRTAELGAMPGIEQVYCFENRGEEVGVTLSHPHGQIYALPYLPPRTQRLLMSARSHRERSGRNLFDDLVSGEEADGRRIVAGNDHWLAFVPGAARWPFEVMIFPRARAADLVSLGESACLSFGQIFTGVLGRLDRLFGAPMPYIAAWQQAPAHDEAARAEFAVHMHVMGIRRAPGRLKYLAGTESGAGVWSNDVMPESAARMLREAGS